MEDPVSEFVLSITTDNDAFTGEGSDPGTELARILREVADKVEGGQRHGILRDYNGAKVGVYDYSEDEVS